MEKENTVKEGFVEISKKYYHLFNTSIDMTFNNLTNEVFNKLFYDINADYEVDWIYQSVLNYLHNDITEYVISKFTDKNMEEMLKKIDISNKSQFDKNFIEHMKWKEDNGIRLIPAEKRLKELIEKEQN